jgi:hypothetical protein
MVGFNKGWIGKAKFEREDYIPLSERNDWDGEVVVLRPYKDHKWTGARFDSHLGQLKSSKKHKGKMG